MGSLPLATWELCLLPPLPLHRTLLKSPSSTGGRLEAGMVHRSRSHGSSYRPTGALGCEAWDMNFPSDVQRSQVTQQKWGKFWLMRVIRREPTGKFISFLSHNELLQHAVVPYGLSGDILCEQMTSCVFFWSCGQCRSGPPFSASHSLFPHSCCPGIASPNKTFTWRLCLGLCFSVNSNHKSFHFGEIKFLQIKNILSQTQLAIILEKNFFFPWNLLSPGNGEMGHTGGSTEEIEGNVMFITGPHFCLQFKKQFNITALCRYLMFSNEHRI